MGISSKHPSPTTPPPPYANPPFGEGGIGCERCRGAGDAHAASGAHIVNPAKLAPDRRDSICAQCHLSGEMRVFRAGASWNSYHPGDRLSDSLTVFVRSGVTPGMRVTSHFEKLAQSACKRAAGDKLWCGSCHDPHSVPAAADRAAWFRTKCLSCHAPNACTEMPVNRARRQDDCIACHMPKSAVNDAQDVVYTDHSIPRRPRPQSAPPPDGKARQAARGHNNCWKQPSKLSRRLGSPALSGRDLPQYRPA